MSVCSPRHSPFHSSKSCGRDNRMLKLLNMEIGVNNNTILTLKEECEKLETDVCDLQKRKVNLNREYKGHSRLLKLKMVEIEEEFNAKTLIADDNVKSTMQEIKQQKAEERKEKAEKLHGMSSALKELYVNNRESIDEIIRNSNVWCYKKELEEKVIEAKEGIKLTDAEVLNIKLKNTLETLEQSKSIVPKKATLSSSSTSTAFEVEGEPFAEVTTVSTNVRYTKYVVEKPLIITNSN